MCDIEEPPEKMSKTESNTSHNEGVEESQEEWLSEDMLTDDDQHEADPAKSESNMDTSQEELEDEFLDETMLSAEHSMDSQNVSQTSQLDESQEQATASITEAAQESSETKEPVAETIEQTLNNLEDHRQEAKDKEADKESRKSDGNDTDDLLRLLGDNEEKAKKKVLVKTKEKNGVNRGIKESAKAGGESSDDDDFVFNGTTVKKLRFAKSALSKKPAARAEPEDFDDDITDCIETVAKEKEPTKLDEDTLMESFSSESDSEQSVTEKETTNKIDDLTMESFSSSSDNELSNQSDTEEVQKVTSPPKKSILLELLQAPQAVRRKNTQEPPMTATIQTIDLNDDNKEGRNSDNDDNLNDDDDFNDDDDLNDFLNNDDDLNDEMVSERLSTSDHSSDEAETMKNIFATKNNNTVAKNTAKTSQLREVRAVKKVVKIGDTVIAPTKKPTPKQQVGLSQSKPAQKTLTKNVTSNGPVRVIVRNSGRTPSKESVEKKPPPPSTVQPSEHDEIINEDEFMEGNEFDLDENFVDKSDEEVVRSEQQIMKPEQMDEEIPTDLDSQSDSDAIDDIFDDVLSADSEDKDDWFSLDIRAERASEYLPLLGDKAHDLLTSEKKRVSHRLASLRRSIAQLHGGGRQQALQLRKAAATLKDLDEVLKAS